MANNTEVKLPQLHAAVRAGDEMRISQCIQSGCDVNLIDDEGKTAIFHATYYNAKVIKMLLDAGADHTVPGASYFQPLHMASRAGNLECVKLLLDAGADVNTRDVRKGFSTALHVAVTNQCMDIIKYLVEHGADMNDDYLIDSGAAIYGNEELIDYLLQKGAPVVWNDDEGWRVLRRVVRMENPEFTRRVIALGANVNAIGYEEVDDDDNCEEEVNALMLAMRYSTVKHVKILLENGADLDDPINSIDNLYWSYNNLSAWEIELMIDRLESMTDKVEELLRRGINVNHRFRSTGRSLLVLALTCSDDEAITLFLDHGADVTAKDDRGVSVIEHAVTMPREKTQYENVFEGLAPFIYHGRRVSESEMESIMSSDARVYYERCVPELKRLESLKFYENLSLLDMLVSTIHKLTDYAWNTKLVDAFYEYFDEEDYPIYGHWLMYKFDFADERKECLKPVAVFFSQVFGFNDPQHIVIRRIMSYLSDYELYRIGEALRLEIS